MSSNAVDTSSSSNNNNNNNADEAKSESTHQAQSRLSGLKAPSRIVRPSIQKPSISVASNSSVLVPAASLLNKQVSSSVASNLNDEGVEPFKVNDRCWVNGTKPGVVAYIGEAQFKEGIWAGVILDSIGEGKNNGSVGGVTYFKTDEMRGVFCRLNKLSRGPEEAASETASVHAESQATVIFCTCI